jgi:hypothetical protein
VTIAPKPRGWQSEGTYSGRAERRVRIVEIRDVDGAMVVVIDSGEFMRSGDLLGFMPLPFTGFYRGLA